MFKVEYLGSALFFTALLHTFFVSWFAKLSHQFKKKSVPEVFFHLLSEVEVVFGFWALIFLIVWSVIDGPTVVIEHQMSVSMNEPLFIFCIMIMAATRPIITASRQLILYISEKLSLVFRFKKVQLQFATLMIVGPLLGSLITEPAAITITSLLLYRMINKEKISSNFLYAVLALLFVNISVGGALTHFAAPPILIVARTWNWGLPDVFMQLGEAAILTVLLNTCLISYIYRKPLVEGLQPIEKDHYPMPVWLVSVHFLFLGALVATSHFSSIYFSLFLVFLGLVYVTKVYQDGLKFREALLVGFFLAGLIVFGSFQKWWLEPLMRLLSERVLYFGAIGLTAFTDNAALTYLGSQVSELSDLSKWALVGGALVGGGLTILANAPNPAGFSILSSHFPDSSLNALKLFKAALLPTLIAMLCFYLKIFILN